MSQNLVSQFKKLNINQIGDLLYFFPFRYEDLSRVTPIKDLQPGEIATVFGKIEAIKNRRSFQRRVILTEAIVSDETGKIKVGWFHQPYLTKVLNVGDWVYLAGKIGEGRQGDWQMVSPVFEKKNKTQKTIHTARIIPIYHTTSALSQKQIRFFIHQALRYLSPLKDWLPQEIRKKYDLLPLNIALREIHFPSNFRQAEKARQRFKFEELFLLQLLAHFLRKDLEEKKALPIPFQQKLTQEFVQNLPFQLTYDQKKAAWEIIQDLSQAKPMNRLLEGEVGSGKTIVTALAILNVLAAGYQVAFMAPTEILAEQHYQTFKKFFEPYNFKIALLTRKTSKKTEVLDSQLVIGTHALIQEKIKFQNLALAIIDEQHRFGVNQRKLLREKSGNYGFMPHLLSVTATPIPRTLALVFYGDLDLSIIKEMPKARKKIQTFVVSDNPLPFEFSLPFKTRQEVYSIINQEIKEGHCVFVVCPLIDVSENFEVRSVKEEFELLKQYFPEKEIAILHGRLKSEEKAKLIQAFREGHKKILISTTVIEVGVDIPKATVMLIENADRFGLAALHQLRGRVGRGDLPGQCFLAVEQLTPLSFKRLKAFLECQDGFVLAEKDLELRGPGEFWGTSQSGFPEFKIASIFDTEIISWAKQAAAEIFKDKDGLDKHPQLKEKLKEFVNYLKSG